MTYNLMRSLLVLMLGGLTTQSIGASEIWFWSPNWTTAEVITFDTKSQTTIRTNMTLRKNGWWFAETQFEVFDFAFTNGKTIDSLGRTGGCYPNNHYKCDKENRNSAFYSTANNNVWVKDGITYPYNPMSKANRNQFLSVLTLNLHTYQEFKTPGKNEADLTEHDARQRVVQHKPLFNKIAQAITQLDADVVCLQEVAEWHQNNLDFGLSKSNAANQIVTKLKGYQVTQDWAHFGWDVWQEGSAVLTKHPIVTTRAKFISDTSQGTYRNWKSRKAVNAFITAPNIDLAVYSVHTGWSNDPDEPFAQQFARLHQWQNVQTHDNFTTLLCGDFNQEATKQGYKLVTEQYRYVDHYAAAVPQGLTHPTIGGDYWDMEKNQLINAGKRIDYIFTLPTNKLKAVQAQRLFTESTFGRVSDHLGVYVHFKVNY